MCGIVGYLGDFSKNEGVLVIKNMANSIIHRGPDDFGEYIEDNIAFAMRRLSIVDLETGHQPIFSEDKSYAIVFNGEIYNHNELREELKNNGVEFNTHSDTEVILKSYIFNGLDFIHKLNGMFAFFILDKFKNIAYIFRDRIGIKPLYYYHNNQNKDFLFASETKAIISSSIYSKEINYQSLGDYLTLRYTDTKNSIWKNIFKLPSGHYIEYDLKKNKFNMKKYWDFEFFQKRTKTNKEYIEEFEKLFLDSVKKRIVSSDVPVGIFLSGGLDSSVIAYAAIEIGHKNFHTFSVGFEDDRGENELKYAKEMSTYINTNHHEVVVTKKDFLDFLPKLPYYTDEPYADLTAIPLYFLSKEAVKYVKVILSGEGADELFAGYGFNTLHSRFKLLKKLERFRCIFFVLKLFVNSKYKRWLDEIEKFGVDNLLKERFSYMTTQWSDEEKDILSYKFKTCNSTNTLIKNLYSFTASNDVIDKVLDSYCRLWLIEDLLMKADKMTMANSLEARVPFLDHRIIEFATKLPTELKVNGTTKYILRDFAKTRIPDNILKRPKGGFSIPVYKWLQDDLNSWAREFILDSKELEIFNKEIILQELEKTKVDITSAHKVWVVIIMHYWLKKWM